MNDLDKVKTGDVVIFGGNTPTGFLLKTMVSSDWNHSGIAVRFKPNMEISLTEEGNLYILETNTIERYDDYFKEKIVGVGFTRLDMILRIYNRIAIRKLKDVFRTETLAKKSLDFAKKYRGSKFPSNSIPFLSVWLGIQLPGKSDNGELFCSELMAHYYAKCVGDQFEKIIGVPFDGKLSSLFGANAPTTEDMYTPGHYTSNSTPSASIFEPEQELVYVQYADLLFIIIQPLILALIVALIIWMLLPHNN